MAAAMIRSLVLKIGAILDSESTTSAVSLLLTWVLEMEEIKKDISEIKNELESMQGFLQTAERLQVKNENIKIFINQIRELAFDIEDIIDEFKHELGEEQERVLHISVKRCKNPNTWRLLSQRLKEIKINIQNITERRKRYDTKGMENEVKPLIDVGSSESCAESTLFLEENDIVGIDKNRDLLLGWLEDADKQQEHHMIFSVVGMGGLGKTTLVTHVYNKIKATFDACAWVVVSQSYETNDFLRKILKELYREDREKRAAPNNIDTMDYRRLVETIRTYLQGKKYVLILDDVWSTDVMKKDLKCALQNSNCKSRIILTTRVHEVAQLANEHCMFELKTLEADHSWDLFCKNAFWKSASKICPSPLEQCAKKIVEKCGGLPLAIISIGRLLSFREQTNSEWENVYKELEWYLTNKLHDKVHNILKHSLDDLPHSHRNCFLYCSCFPEDYEIYRESLKWLLVAEGFIEERSERTMEDVAEDYLKELVHRCLLQVAKRDDIGRVISYRMHDVIRVLAISQSKEESFCMVYEHSRTMLQLDKARRLSIISSTTNYCTKGKSQLRSILVFNNSMSSDLVKSVLRSSKLLRVLELKGGWIKELPSEICNLFNLHYLSFEGMDIKELPRSIGKLQNLQILDMDKTKIEKLPKEITELQKLRHLLLPFWSSCEVPVEIRCLKGLQTLKYIQATTEIVQSLEALTELRTFWINDVRTHHCADLWNSITKMNHLSDLTVFSERGHELQQLDTLHLPLPIQNLYLEGKLDKNSFPELATSIGSLTNLTRLELYDSKLDEDPFPYLQALPALMLLELRYGAYDGTKLHFQATSFPKLKQLHISKAMKLSQVEIERGAMPSLNKLELWGVPELRELPHGIEYLTTLQDLDIKHPTEELIERLLEGEGEGYHNNDCRARVRHIPNFTIYFQRDGKFVEERIQ